MGIDPKTKTGCIEENANGGHFFARAVYLSEFSQAKRTERGISHNFSVTLQRLIINKIEWILSTTLL